MGRGGTLRLQYASGEDKAEGCLCGKETGLLQLGSKLYPKGACVVSVSGASGRQSGNWVHFRGRYYNSGSVLFLCFFDAVTGLLYHTMYCVDTYQSNVT